MRLHGTSPLGGPSPARSPLLGRPGLPGGPLRLLLVFFLAGSAAHALPSRRSGLHDGELAQPNTATAAVKEEERGADPEPHPPSLPPAPSEELLARMYRHNIAFNYGYAFWNVTDLDSEGCRRLANETTAERAEQDAPSCVSNYSCDFDRLRYPHWLVFTGCSRGPGPCYPEGRPEDEWRFSCFPHEEDILLLRFVEFSRNTAARRSASDGNDGGAAAPRDLPGTPSPDEKPDDSVASPEKGEWQLWFYQIPSECRCFV